ncbi:PREDICTED: neprilysin-11-like isoform X2 [Nicrophorus vespilloides]|uniref:Neprilysin-11-like isoform X2 n=1 Tax=Nicrophorus vespilloides TaxID=110193 RepID=A0ABM1MXP2_NICVS|nr:PREDICTED: neprilysin-11-like isoform X2 [Nicrophorus vespilloides]
MGKKCATFTLITLIGALCLLLALFIIYSGSYETCTSKECVKSASEMLTYLDTTVQACDNFYGFTCGNFHKDVVDENESLMSFLKNSKLNQVRLMIEEGDVPKWQPLHKVKSFYRSCINETSIEEDNLARIRSVLREMGGWPLLERGDWRDNLFDWKRATHQLRKIGFEFTPFLHIQIDINIYDSSAHILKISSGMSEFLSDIHGRSYRDYMTETAVYFGGDRNRAERESKEVAEFEDRLQKILNRVKYAGPSGPRTLAQVQYDFPGIPWVDYVNGILYPTTTVTHDEPVTFSDLEYVRDFHELLEKTPKRVVANYMAWHVIQSLMPYLPDKLRRIRDKHNPGKKPRTRREDCMDITRQSLPEIIETSYVQRYVSDEAKRQIKDIIKYVKKEYNRVLENLDWLDADARQVARAKLASSRDYIAYTQEAIRRKNQQQQQHTGPRLEVRADVDEDGDFLGRYLNVSLQNLNKEYRRLIEPVHEDEANNLIYSIKENTLVLPSYYLQGLFFNEFRPQYMNFGALGSLIAYELSNLFVEGRRYDLYGNLREWSTSQSLLNYENRVKCIESQYSQLNVPGIGKHVNTNLSREDDFALLLGKTVAFEAYLSWAEGHETEPHLPGLQYNPRQFFWISSAMPECWSLDTMRPNPKTHRSIAQLRVLGPLRNMEKFAGDFRCPLNALMNPERKCTVN